MRTAPVPPNAPAAADPARLLSAFRRQLTAEAASSEPVSYEEIEAYVDGLGDETSRTWIAERIERDPALAAAVADLTAFKSQFETSAPRQEPVRVLPFRRSEPRRTSTGLPATRRRFGWVAVAAAALLAVAVVGPSEEPGQEGRSTVAGTTPTATAPAGGSEPVFVDGFEEGSPAEWSSVASGG
jgi:hypothetical protein